MFGIFGHPDAAAITALGLHALQHRGQEAAGIVSFDGSRFHSERRLGLVGDTFSRREVIERLPGNAAVGHIRYSTTGGTILRNVQPLMAELNTGGFALAHNGNLTNGLTLRRELVRNGAMMQSTTDTEVILHLVALSKRSRFIDRFIEAVRAIEGAYSLVSLTNKKLIGARDPLGIRPLVLGELDGCPILASETCALDIIGAKYVRDIEHGEVIVFDERGMQSHKPFPPRPPRPCIFEYIYFSRPDSIVGGRSVYDVRTAMGAQLARESHVVVDVIVPVPDSGVAAAIGYSQHSGVPFAWGIIRNHYVGRTFIQPTQSVRELGVRMKHSANRAAIEGKRIILIDDSLIRGTTAKKIVRMMRDAGAREVHFRLASPPIRHPDYYGIDLPDRGGLLAATHSLEEMRNIIGVDSLAFLSIDGMYRAMGEPGRDPRQPRFADHFFTGEYPTNLTDQTEPESIPQEIRMVAGAENVRWASDKSAQTKETKLPPQMSFERIEPQERPQNSASTGRTEIEARVIDVNLLTERFVVGEIAVLTVTILLRDAGTRGKWQEQIETIPEAGDIQILTRARGFDLISEPPPTFRLNRGQNSPPMAFEFRITEASERWLHILLMQNGRVIGELSINNFAEIGGGPSKQIHRNEVRKVDEADLTLVFRGPGEAIEAYSPSERASLYGVNLGMLKELNEQFRTVVRQRIRRLYDPNSNAIEAERELRIIGAELTSCLPKDLIGLLHRKDIRTVMVRHEDNFDFPLELCYIDSADDSFFLGDRLAVCRWYLGVTSPPNIVRKRIRKVALLQGKTEAFALDQALLGRLFPGKIETLHRRRDVIDKLLKTADFDLIHFTGHCAVDEGGEGGLELADDSFLRLIEIGQLEAERKFTSAQPFVMLNACGSGQPYIGLTDRDSFAHRFVVGKACAFVGTLWPVSGPVANEFARHLYSKLCDGFPIGRALQAAKGELTKPQDNRSSDDEVNLHLLARQIAVRSYCLFAHPDFRIQS